MKKILITSIITSGLLLAGPVHTLMDDRIKGQSYSGEKSDYNASKDGLGIIPLQHHSGTSQINNELKIQKKLVELKKKTIDISKLSNIKQSLTNGEIGTIQDKNFIEKLDNNTSVKKEIQFDNININEWTKVYEIKNNSVTMNLALNYDEMNNKKPRHIMALHPNSGRYIIIKSNNEDFEYFFPSSSINNYSEPGIIYDSLSNNSYEGSITDTTSGSWTGLNSCFIDINSGFWCIRTNWNGTSDVLLMDSNGIYGPSLRTGYKENTPSDFAIYIN